LPFLRITPGGGLQLNARVMAVCFAAGSLYGWSALIPALREAYGLGVAEAGQAFSMAIVAFTVSVLLVPRLAARWRGQRAVSFCGFLAAIVTFAAAWAPGFWVFIVLFSIGFGGLSGAIYILALETAAQSRSPQVATPLMVAAFGLGGAVFAVVFRRLIALDWGLAALPSLSAVLTVSSLWAATTATGWSAPVEKMAPGSQLIRAAGPSRVAVALLWAAFAFGSGSGLMALGLASAIIDDRGASGLLTSVVVAGVPLGNMLGRLSVSLLQRWMRPVRLVGLSPVTGLAALAALYIVQSSRVSAVAIIVLATSYGLLAASMPILTNQLSGPARFGAVFSIVFTGWGAAGLAAPWAAGFLRDSTGDFAAAFLMAMGSCVLAIVAVLSVAAGGHMCGAEHGTR